MSRRPASRRIATPVAAAAAAAALLLPAAGATAGRQTELAPARASIVNGYVPHPSQWPWTAALLFSETFRPQLQTDLDRHFCGGTLIRPRVVLTAAHCILSNRVSAAGDVLVVLGRRDLRQPVGERLAVAQVVVHPDYQPGRERNDAAVLHLAAASALAPASILDPRASLREGRRATVMGWGLTSDQGSASAVLRAADVPLWSPRRCKAAWKFEYLPSSMVCAGYLNGQVDSCNGDSGGPLMVRDAARQWRLLGIVSFGAKCAQPDLPGVYAWVNARAIAGFIAREAAKDPTPAGSGTVVATPGAEATAPPADDETAPRIGTVRLGADPRSIRARFRLSEAAQVTATVFDARGRRVRGPLTRGLRAGARVLRIRGRLRAGRYRLVIRAVDGALNSSARIVRLRVRG